MKRTELENGIAKQLSSVILREDEMLENIMQMVDAHVNKLLLPNVVGQSEQLHTKVFNLANELAKAGYGNEAVRMHHICNGM